jgi:hypothetical protein
MRGIEMKRDRKKKRYYEIERDTTSALDQVVALATSLKVLIYQEMAASTVKKLNQE